MRDRMLCYVVLYSDVARALRLLKVVIKSCNNNNEAFKNYNCVNVSLF